MKENRIKYFCKTCGKPLKKDEHPCPKCGSSFRLVCLYNEDNITIKETSIKGNLKRPSIQGYAYIYVEKYKVSGETKKPAKERLLIDRIHPEKTVKDHKVWEKVGEEWVICHNEHIVSKAKHRKKKEKYSDND